MRVKSFQLYNHEIEVLYLEEVWDDDGEKVFGTCDMQGLVIKVAIMSPNDGTPLKESVIFHNFFHEFGHALMGFIDEKFNTNEVKIDRLGALIAQAVSSAKLIESAPL